MKQTAKDIKDEVVGQDDWSLRVLTLVAGLLMVFASINGFMGKLVTFQLSAVICDIIVCVVGLAFIILESGLIRLPICATTEAVIDDKAPFLRSLAGRGVAFIATGILEIYMGGMVDIIVGAFAIYVGGMYFLTRHRTKQKVDAARKSAMATGRGLEDMQEQFAMADVDGRGSLNLVQFRMFANAVGLDLDKRESEAAFISIDKHDGNNGRVSYEAIQTWWSHGQT